MTRHASGSLLGVLAAGQALVIPALAQGTPGPAPGKSGYHLFNPTPRALMREMSTDRPDTTESPYTVDAGHFQVELSVVDYTRDSRNDDDLTTRTLSVAPVLLKAGVLHNVDVQLGLDPFTRTRTEERASGIRTRDHGFGDTVVRLKINLWGNDGGTTAFALMPFISFPTAGDDLGSGNVEGGLIAPLSIGLPGEFSLGLMGEVDFIRSAADDRYVLDLVHTATVAHDLFGSLGGFVEYAGFANLNGDEDYRAYLDAGLTYAVSGDVQLDAGVRIGLTRAADDLGLFAGISVRF